MPESTNPARIGSSPVSEAPVSSVTSVSEIGRPTTAINSTKSRPGASSLLTRAATRSVNRPGRRAR